MSIFDYFYCFISSSVYKFTILQLVQGDIGYQVEQPYKLEESEKL